MTINRREFVVSLAAGALACARAPRVAAPPRLKFGYASITWGANDLVAIDEISALGYPGIQVRANTWSHFSRAPQVFQNLMLQKKLTFVALSSGSVSINPDDEAQSVGERLVHAHFVRDAGGLFLQVTDELPRGRAATPDDCQKLGALLNKIGAQTADLGVPLAYHPHMGTIGETPENLERILAASDPKLVRLLLDVAHYQQGGGDPAAAIRRHGKRLAFLHLKDVETKADGSGYRFVELGRGRVDLPAVFAALADVGFAGWAIVELDGVTDAGRSARESAEISRRYLESRGFAVS
ncbi:MAG: TIM barrel protein [Gemmatimonadaceae bacterium]